MRSALVIVAALAGLAAVSWVVLSERSMYIQDQQPSHYGRCAADDNFGVGYDPLLLVASVVIGVVFIYAALSTCALLLRRPDSGSSTADPPHPSRINAPVRRLPLHRPGARLAASAVFSTVLLSVLLALAYGMLSTTTFEQGTQVVHGLLMSGALGGSCASSNVGGMAFTTFSVSISGVSPYAPVATSDITLSLSTTNNSTASPAPTRGSIAGAGSSCPAGSSGLVPVKGGWEAVLLAAGGGPAEAVWGGAMSAWTQANGASLEGPVAITSGMTLVIVATGGVNLVQSQVFAQGVMNCPVAGSIGL